MITLITSRWLKRGSILRNFLEKYIVGRKRYQWFFQKLHLLSIAGLNYGEGSYVESSGEEFVMRWFRDRWNRKCLPIIFDVGANKGDYCKAMLDSFYNNCIIHAFEPSKETFNLFCSNVKNIRVYAHNFGFSDKREKLILYSNMAASGLASVYQRKTTAGLELQEEIELLTIDSFCQQENISTINFMKIDVEGHELKVLHGSKDMLKRRAIEIIQFEFGGCNVDSRTYFHDFWQVLHNDFVIYRILKDGLHPIINYSLLDEIFVTVNFLAELRK